MKITTVSLSRTIPTGPYENVKISMEGMLEGEESPFDALDKLKRLIDHWYINEYPPKESQDALLTDQILNDPYLHPPKTPIIDYGKDSPEGVLADIKNTKTLEELTSFKLIAGTDKELYAAYCQQLKYLSA